MGKTYMINKRELFLTALMSAAILLMSISIAGAQEYSGDFILQKTATTNNPTDSSTYNAAGQIITYNYSLQDLCFYGIGPAPFGKIVSGSLSQPIYIIDNKTGTINTPGNDLLIGTSQGTSLGGLEGSSTYKITQDDIDRGYVTNSATAYGQGVGVESSNTDTVTVYRTGFLPNPNGYQFPNYGSGIHSLDEFLNTYHLDLSSYILSPKYQEFYKSQFRNDSIPGNCFGMVATSLSLYNNRINNTYSYSMTSPVPNDWMNLGLFFN